MAYWDLEIEIIVREKGRILSQKKEVSNNDIFWLRHSWMAYLEERIGNLAYKVAMDCKLKRM